MSLSVKNHYLYRNNHQIRNERTARKSRGILPANPDLVIHYTVGESFNSMVAALSAPKAGRGSAHIVLGRQGELAQVENFKTRLWHAGLSHWKGRSGLNSYSIGIEVCCQGWLNERNKLGQWRQRSGRYRSRWFDPDEDRLVIGKHPNPAVYIPTYGPGTKPNVCAWPLYTPEQMVVLDELVPLLVRLYNVREVVGHDDISPGRKQDPGPCLPAQKMREWNRLGAPDPNPKIITSQPLPDRSADYPMVGKGDRGPTVAMVQKRLLALGYKSVGPADGIFGTKTQRALKAFQVAHELVPDGVAGPNTYAKLLA